MARSHRIRCCPQSRTRSRIIESWEKCLPSLLDTPRLPGRGEEESALLILSVAQVHVELLIGYRDSCLLQCCQHVRQYFTA